MHGERAGTRLSTTTYNVQIVMIRPHDFDAAEKRGSSAARPVTVIAVSFSFFSTQSVKRYLCVDPHEACSHHARQDPANEE